MINFLYKLDKPQKTGYDALYMLVKVLIPGRYYSAT